MTTEHTDHPATLLTPDDQKLADDYVRWLLVLTLGTIAGCIATVVVIYMVRPEWITAFLDAL